MDQFKLDECDGEEECRPCDLRIRISDTFAPIRSPGRLLARRAGISMTLCAILRAGTRAVL